MPPSAYAKMALVLRIGLLAALAILAAAITAFCLAHPSTTPAAVITTNPILRYLGLAPLWQGLARGTVEAYLTLGVLVLLATPILRVLSGFYYFRRGREVEMSAITFAVLALLLFGLLVLGPALR